MKKFLYSFIFVFCISFFSILPALSLPEDMSYNMFLEQKISEIGLKILNANKLDKRVIFTYYNENDMKKVKLDKGLSRKEVVVVNRTITAATDENELAALLALSIGETIDSYRGFFASLQAKLAPKKFELLYDKRAVDYMVNAGFNPVALITFMNKAFPQQQDFYHLNENSTSARLANIYEYIYTMYPYFLQSNPYLYTESYQNFLLTSTENRILLKNKIESGSTKSLNYE